MSDQGASADTPILVPTPKPSMGAPQLTRPSIWNSSSPPLAIMLTYPSPASSRMPRTSLLRAAKSPLSRRTPCKRWPIASISFPTSAAFLAPEMVS